MQPTTARNTAYTGNRAEGDSTNIYGNVYGGVHFPSRADSAGGTIAHQCLRALRYTDPREDRARIEGDKDKLLKDCYAWILNDTSFQRWRTLSDSRLLWIRGDPGKGKTMMTMGLIAELSQGHRAKPSSGTMSKMLAKLKLGSRPCLLAYFFCQSTRPELSNALSVLRGLIYLLVEQKEQLMRHVQKRYEAMGSKLFEGPNAIHTLREILSDILNDPDLPTTYLLVDALDECTTDLSALLRIITHDSLVRRSRVKWLVTSRNVPEIERYLQPDLAGVKVSLEVSVNQISTAVAAFVDFKVQGLATVKRYNAKLQAEVLLLLRDRAEGTFLWVSLVCKELESVPLYRTREVLQTMPRGLDPLYDRMMAQILAQDDVKTKEYCQDVLRAVTIAFRPLHLRELVIVAGLPSDQFDNPQAVTDLVSHCGSFLTIRRETVFFIHLSAKDYLTLGNGRQVFDTAEAEEHGQVTYRLLNAMRSTLQRDLCGLEKLGTQLIEMTERAKDSVLPQIAYACEYWVDHLCNSNLTSLASSASLLQDQCTIDVFLREKFLYWLEALSLCKSVSKGVVSIDKLWSLLQARNETSAFAELVKDAHRFVMYHRGAIESSPLQTLEGHSNSVNSVAFSHDSARLASASWDNTVKIWDASSGTCLQTLEGHSHSVVDSVAFSHDSTRLASASNDNTVKIWDASSGTCLQTLEGHSHSVFSVAFSHDSARLASASWDNTVKIWDASSGKCLQTLEGRSGSDLVSVLASLYPHKVVKNSWQPIYQDISISADRTWICNNAQKLLWLPTEYRPVCTAVSGRYVGLGTGSGKVWICRLV